jgi:hypothetical protein
MRSPRERLRAGRERDKEWARAHPLLSAALIGFAAALGVAAGSRESFGTAFLYGLLGAAILLSVVLFIRQLPRHRRRQEP